MAAKGTEEKQIITSKILETFDGAFINGKEIRIPINDVEIKINLVCAKDILGAEVASQASSNTETSNVQIATAAAPTQEELDNVKSLLSALTF